MPIYLACLRPHLPTCIASLRAHVPTCLECLRVHESCVLTSQRVLSAYVPTCLSCLHDHVRGCFACSLAHVTTCLECLRASRVNMPCVLMYSCFNVACEFTCSRANMPWVPCLQFHCHCCWSCTLLVRFKSLISVFPQ